MVGIHEVVTLLGCRYVSGDPRFRSYSKSNPRKMVKMWAEKEMRNLARLHAAGIRCPKPHMLRLHVLVMDFIGLDGVAALRLKVCPTAMLSHYVTSALGPYTESMTTGAVKSRSGLLSRET